MKRYGTPVDALFCSLLESWAKRCPSIVNPPPLPLPSPPEDDPMQRDRYDRAMAAAKAGDLEALVAAVREGPWQAPYCVPSLELPDYSAFRGAGASMAEQNQLGDLFDFGTRLRDSNGMIMNGLVGTGLRTKARKMGHRSPDLPTWETSRTIIRNEVLRFALPSTLVGTRSESIERRSDIAPFFYARVWANRILFGGKQGAFDREDTVERLQHALNGLLTQPTQREIADCMRREAPFAPYDAYSVFGKPRTLWEWAVKSRVIPIRAANPLGRLGVAALYNSAVTLLDAFEGERRVAHGA